MYKYKITFRFNGARYEEEVSAKSESDAKKLIEGRYPGCSIIRSQKI